MKQKDVFGYVIDVLNRLRIAYMISDSIASIAYGKPRLTYDMDIIIDLDQSQAKELASSFDKEWSVDLEGILEAIQKGGHFNIVHFQSGSKIDFFLRGDTEFAQTEFKRRRKEKFDKKRQAIFATPEDIIIKKLDYYQQGRSEKHLEDIQGILEISKELLDFPYINRWTKKKRTYKIWKKLYGATSSQI